MSNQETQTTAPSAFDELVEAMPRIAEAVKAFPEAVQGKAFDALMGTLTGAAPPAATTDGLADASEGKKTTTKKKTSTRKQSTDNSKTGMKRRAGGPTLVKDLDLAPKGKKSLKDFVAEKAPSSQNDKNVVSVYWLGQIAEITPTTSDHVFTCYRSEGWQIPADFRNSLQTTASKKGYVDTSAMPNVTITNIGINRVERGLPETKKT